MLSSKVPQLMIAVQLFIVNRSYALMKRLDYAQDLALMKKASDKKHNSTKYSALQSIDVHWFFIERTEICQLSWIGRSDEHLA